MKAPLLTLVLLAGCAAAPAPPPAEAEAPPQVALPAIAPAPDPAPTRQDISCPPLPTLPARPTSLQRQIHLETIVALYVRCAGR